MSYDIGLYINTGIEEVEVKDIGNYTYNVSPMFKEAFGVELFDHSGINGLSGMVAKDCIPHLERAVHRMESDPDGYTAMNPANGWGDYAGALNYLREALYACREHPSTILRVY